MKNESLIIMAGGASSRMKKSLSEANLGDEVHKAAQNLHKSLIPLDEEKRPLLYFLLQNAIKAGLKNIYIITSEENQGFHDFLKTFGHDATLSKLHVQIAVQHVPDNRVKPLGTADAVEQCLEQYPELLEGRFSVCNGDNLYSTNVMQLLANERTAAHATIAYKGSGLGFDDERLSKFALLDIDPEGFLKRIVEKPKMEEMEQYRDKQGELLVSMNIFNFSGSTILSYLKDCPINVERDEKELPEAVRAIAADNANSVFCFKVNERIPDLTTAHDIGKFKNFL